MKFPLEWLSEYTKIKNTPDEIGDIFTYLEFMQDGPIKNNVIDLEVRQNRPDALSVIGLAIEYAAKTNSKIIFPKEISDLQFDKPDKLIYSKLNNQVKRFTAVKIDNIKVSSSPDYIVNRLIQSGIRSVNNVVDITNYVMLEYGIPMHVFDANKLGKDYKLTLRMGKKGESLETWLGEKVQIDKTDIVVANNYDQIVSLGGITGEKNSGASDSTTCIVLEAANYDQSLIRQSALKHNLLTDSANRHTKILPSSLVETAIKRACFLIGLLCKGQIVLAEDYYKEKQTQFDITLNVSQLNNLGAVKINTDEIKQILNGLMYQIVNYTKNQFILKSPIHRTDVKQSVDVIEDILRIYGYQQIKQQEIKLAAPQEITPPIYKLEEQTKDLFVAMGFDEHITEPLVKDDKNPDRIILENSLNSKKNSLRLSIEETLGIVLTNYKKHKRTNIKIFEVGKIYKKINNLYTETSVIGLMISTNNNYKKIKGVLETYFKRLGVGNMNLNLSDNKRYINIMISKTQIGFIKYSLNNSLYCEVNLEELLKSPKENSVNLLTNIPFEHEQLFNLVVNENVLFNDIEKVINTVKTFNKDTKIKTDFIEEYKDEILAKSKKKSYLISLKIQNLLNPVSKEEFKPIKEKVLKLLRSNLEIELKEK